MITKAKCLEAIALAQEHQNEGQMISSARLCVNDAVSLYCKGEYSYAFWRAIKSLAYSVGIFGADYQRALALWEGQRPWHAQA